MQPIRRKFPIGIQSFEELRSNGYVYVDKTEVVYDLIQSGKTFFLSRPRRFGKSLLVSTLKAYFEGKKHLFEGLAMERMETEWTKHEVLHTSFATSKVRNAEQLNNSINTMLARWEALYGKNPEEKNNSDRFAGVIERAAKQSGKQVVVLIDEYDAPILSVLTEKPDREAIKYILRDFFSPLKDMGEHIRFLFLTGVTKYSQLSIFSELNHLVNISMLPQFGSICGITEDELFSNFKQDVEDLAVAKKLSYDGAVEKLKRLYDGYHFCNESPDIYNPFSLLHVFAYKQFAYFWFESATPTFLLDVLQDTNLPIDDLDRIELKAERFNKPIMEDVDPIPLLYHSGYLTIKDYDEEFNTYTIGFPNEEVRQGLVDSLIPRILPHLNDDQNLSIPNFVKDLRKGDINMFLTRLRSFFADVPNVLNNKTEKHYQTMFYIFTRLIGQYAQVEIPTARGRVDMLIRTGGYLYLFEFKFNATAAEALAQINSKEYAIAYVVDNDKVVKIGLNFDDTTRTITEWIVE